MAKLKDPGTCRIFFSSPFNGMEEEREELTRKYFPQIHHLCNSKGLQFVAVDMRWGITAESSENAQVINICLRELDRSDMFVGFFGQRYGWHGAEDKVLQQNFDNAVGRYPWLNDVRDKSVTELEFLHGHLNNPGKLPACIYFRDKSFDEAKREEGKKKGDMKHVIKYSAESEHSTEMLEDLKRKVWETRDKCLEVQMNYKTPKEAAEMIFKMVWKYLTEVLLVNQSAVQQSRLDMERLQHEAIQASRSNVYVGGNIEQLDKNLDQDIPDQILVKGPPGIGKSALLAKWISRLKKLKRECAVIYHFIGYSEGSSEIPSFMRRLAEEFEMTVRGYSGMGDILTESKTDIDVREMMQRLVVAMESLLKLGKKPVLILDGLDKVSRASKIDKPLYWLPSVQLVGSVLVLSTLDSDTESITELEVHRKFKTITVTPLNTQEKQEMCIQILQTSGKELSPHQLQRIVEAKQTENPLFLNITLSELVSFGYFRLLDKKIDSLVNSKGIEELFQEVLQRLEGDYNVEEYPGPLVEQVLCCIHLSHQGMSEKELLEIFNIPSHVWSPLYFAIEKVIINHGGLFKFGFMELNKAVIYRYLSDSEKRMKYIRILIEHFEKQKKQLTLLLPVFSALSKRICYELPWLWLALDDKNGLAQCLADFHIFSRLQEESPYDLVYLWKQTGCQGNEIADKLLQTFVRGVGEIYVHFEERGELEEKKPGFLLESFLQRASLFLDDAGYSGARLKILERHLKVLTDGGADTNPVFWRKLLHCQYSIACVCVDLQRAEQGIQIHQELWEKWKKKLSDKDFEPSQEDYKEIGFIHHGLGVGYFQLRDFEKALKFYKESIEYHTKAKTKQDTICETLNNMGLIQAELGQLEEALEYCNKVIKVTEEQQFGYLSPNIGNYLTNKAVVLRKMGRLDEAEETYQQSLKIKINAVGREHPIVGMAYLNLGALEMYRNSYQKALEYYMMGLAIFRESGLSEDEYRVLQAKENILNLYMVEENFKKAETLYQETLDNLIRTGSMDRCLPSLHNEMAKYFIRQQRYEEAAKTVLALIQSQHAQPTNYIHLDYLQQNMPPDMRSAWPDKYNIDYGIQLWPGSIELAKWKAEHYLIPDDDAEGLVTLLAQLHDNVMEEGAGREGVYVHTPQWCLKQDGTVVENCFYRIVEEGLKKYPDNLEIKLDMAKSLARQTRFQESLEHMVALAVQLPDNSGILHFASYVALQSGDHVLCTEYCNKLLEKFAGDDEITKKAKSMLSMAKEVEEYYKKKDSGDKNEADYSGESSQLESET
ncbi:hypothetical protein CHS0354_011736 [Potamilus streckersoni]|uniref:Nephrocystin-3 n=1 Tax=Potamilus streckersoni TaxID=2493646 RepID=A0AAE0VWR1_9BIVA|nr:hypothetical protein CHS0354_011736 [Potamilus streckersoni]